MNVIRAEFLQMNKFRAEYLKLNIFQGGVFKDEYIK